MSTPRRSERKGSKQNTPSLSASVGSASAGSHKLSVGWPAQKELAAQLEKRFPVGKGVHPLVALEKADGRQGFSEFLDRLVAQDTGENAHFTELFGTCGDPI